jgi:mannosyltransferase
VKTSEPLLGPLRHSALQHISVSLSWLAGRIEWLALPGAALLLTGLSLYELDRYSFWRDEIMSVIFSSASLPELLTIVGRDRSVADVPFMATYNLLLHFWLQIADTEAQVRFLSVLAGAATVVPVYFIGRRLGGKLAAALGALTFAASPYVIAWSQEARSYSLAMFASATITLLLLRAIERPTMLRWLAYGIVAAAGLYVHSFIGLVIAVHAGYVVLTGSWPPVRPLVAGLVPLGIAALPIPYLALHYGSMYGWIPPLSVGQIRNVLAALGGGTATLVAITALITAAVVSRRRDSRVWLVLAVILVPITLTIGVSTIKPMLLARYLVVCVPAMAVLVGVGLSALRPAVVRAVAIGAMAVLLALSIPTAYTDSHGQDWRSAGAWIAHSAGPRDAVVTIGWGRRHLDYYLRRAEDGVVPRHSRLEAALADPPDGQLWVVMTNLTRRERRDVFARLDQAFQVEEERQFGRKVHIARLTPTG